MRLLKGSSTKFIVILKRGTCDESLENESNQISDSFYMNSRKRSNRWPKSIYGQRKAD